MTRFKIEDVKATKESIKVKLPVFGGMWQDVPDSSLREVLRFVPKDKRLAGQMLKRVGYVNLPNFNAGPDVPITTKEKRKYKKSLRIRRRKMRYTIDFKMPQEKDTKEVDGQTISAMLSDLIAYDDPEIWKIHDVRENKLEIEWADQKCNWPSFIKFVEWLEEKTYISKVTGIRRVEK